MWVFYHPLATIRSDSAVKRALDPRKLKLTRESNWLFRANVFIPSIITAYKPKQAVKDISDCNTLGHMPYLEKASATWDLPRGQPSWHKDVPGWLNIEEDIQWLPSFYILTVTLARQ